MEKDNMIDAFAFEAARMFTQNELVVGKLAAFPDEIAFRMKEAFIMAKEALQAKDEKEIKPNPFR